MSLLTVLQNHLNMPLNASSGETAKCLISANSSFQSCTSTDSGKGAFLQSDFSVDTVKEKCNFGM